MATEKQVRMTSQLYEIRDTMRSLLGAKYKSEIEEVGKGLEAIAARQNISPLQLAIRAGKVLNGYELFMVLAAAVELSEPSVDPLRHD